ncbi:MAG: SMC-Scp complex subunit ScpB [Bacillaceae bacterium]
MDKMKQIGVLEGLLFVAGDEGLHAKQISEVMEISLQEVSELIQQLKEQLKNEDRGFIIFEFANIYQLATKKEHAHYYKKLVETPSQSSLSQAALETLAIVAYKQPITRGEIEEIRGVKTDKALQTLLSKLLIKEVGRAEGTGRPILYGTTKDFLDYFGLKEIEELPPLPEDFLEENDAEADLFFKSLSTEG